MKSPLRIGYLSTLYHTSHLLRQQRSVEQYLGIDCHWLLFGTGPEMIKAFQEKKVDLGYIGLPPAIIGISQGLPLICIGGGHVEGTVILGGKSFKDCKERGDLSSCLQQFVGRRIGIPAAGSIHDVIFRALLQEQSVQDVEIVNYAWADLIPYALNKGEIDGAVGTPPLAILCERESGTHILVSPQLLWPFNPSYGIVSRPEVLTEEPLVNGFLKLHEKACNLIIKSPEKAARLTVSALPGLDESFVQRVYNLSPRYCASLPEPYIQSTLRFIPVMKTLGYLEAAFQGTEEIFETRFIEKIHPEPYHY